MALLDSFIWRKFVRIIRLMHCAYEWCRSLLYHHSPQRSYEEKNIEWWKCQAAFLSTGELLGNLDHLSVRPTIDGIYISMRGWLCHESQNIKTLDLLGFPPDDGVVAYGLTREDLKAAFPGKRKIYQSGFVAAYMLPYCNSSILRQTIRFLVSLENKRIIEGSFGMHLPGIWPSSSAQNQEDQNVFVGLPVEENIEVSRILIAEGELSDIELETFKANKLSDNEKLFFLFLSCNTEEEKNKAFIANFSDNHHDLNIKFCVDFLDLKEALARIIPFAKEVYFSETCSEELPGQLLDILISFPSSAIIRISKPSLPANGGN